MQLYADNEKVLGCVLQEGWLESGTSVFVFSSLEQGSAAAGGRGLTGKLPACRASLCEHGAGLFSAGTT